MNSTLESPDPKTVEHITRLLGSQKHRKDDTAEDDGDGGGSEVSMQELAGYFQVDADGDYIGSMYINEDGTTRYLYDNGYSHYTGTYTLSGSSFSSTIFAGTSEEIRISGTVHDGGGTIKGNYSGPDGSGSFVATRISKGGY
ncbi:hypothetical protein PDESU_04418 [Pontiella desulfatans]|uniref:Uncharacterized protein n=1 Tax=Pontiella desulfatans TaxID=2750659 RepID=A0A6C2U8K0_PONDE|nr:hypothetical protein [Pontiella desulfatans]VGO15831.1 hypothetical protein PDESU_04418 [Pontiella desulfatans]